MEKLKTRPGSNLLMRSLQERVISLAAMIVLVIAICGIIWPKTFLTVPNLKSVLLNVSIRSIVALGMMNLLISGYIDLSVSSLLALSGGLAAVLITKNHFAPGVAILISLSIGAVVGLVNGFMVAVIGINPMIQTLAMQYICSGLCLVIAGPIVSGLPKGFTWLGQRVILGMQMPIVFMLLLVILLTFLNEKTVFFRRNYYIGGNQKSAALSGINVKGMIMFNYVVTGLLAAFAGILTAARLGTASSTAGTSLEMKCICACVLGGASMQGGKGRVLGALLGMVFMGILDNIIVIAGVPVEWNNVVTGTVLALAVTLDVFLQKRKV
ncbi:MAG: ABC transporter permease [Oscillospiraceae bacterium]|nr:ABC transporter permease [Oscillospiraceae bacterium]